MASTNVDAPANSTSRVDGEKDNYEDVALGERSTGIDESAAGSTERRDVKDFIVPPEGKQTGLLARVKKPRPLPSKRRLGAMM